MPSIVTSFTRRGCSICESSLLSDFTYMIMRETLTPPAVEPAQPPTNMSSSSTAFENIGHRLKSALAKPVVVITEAHWKAAYFKHSRTLP